VLEEGAYRPLQAERDKVAVKQLERWLPTKSRGKIGYLLAIVFPLLVAYDAFFRPWDIYAERGLFLGWILLVAIFFAPLKSQGVVRRKIYFIIDLILIATVIACATHIVVDWRYIVAHLGMAPRPIDMALGIGVTVITLEATRRRMFPLVPVCLLFLAYALYGCYLPGIMEAPPLTLSRLIMQLYLSYTANGLYGLCLHVAISYIIPFLLVGGLLRAMGAMDVLNDLVNKLVGRTAGGPAKIACITSAVFGTMSGSAVANVAFTGTFTIPIMKRYGYKPEFAAGVEAASSTGGQLMPPIMGAAAFFMADYTGLPYLHICLAAALPALLYFTSIFLRVHFKAIQEGLVKPSADIVGRIVSTRELIPRLIPLIIIFAILMAGLLTWTPTKAAIVTAVAIIAVSFLRREMRLTPRKIIAGLIDTTNSFVPIAGAIIAFGILIATTMVSGLGLKFSTLMLSLSGENLVLLLLVTAAACLIMGMGVGGLAVYVFAAVMIAPSLIKCGVPMMQAHLFIFYFAQIQCITPPVCLASYTAASIAGANPVKTALTAISIGFIGWVVPFFFVMHPELNCEGSPMSIGIIFLVMVIGLVALTVGLGGYSNRQHNLWGRALFLIVAAVMFAYWNIGLSVAAVVMMGIMILAPTILKKRSHRGGGIR